MGRDAGLGVKVSAEVVSVTRNRAFRLRIFGWGVNSKFTILSCNFLKEGRKGPGVLGAAPER